MNRLVIITLLVLVLALPSCKKSTVVIVDLGYDYFPTAIGNYVVYDVDSIHIDEPAEIWDTSYYQLKEVIAEDFIDNEGNLAQRIERYQRLHDSLPWVIKDVWASNRSSQSGERVEENERIIRMAFPVRQNITWDANALNTEQTRTMTYENFHVPFSINGFAFDSTAKVVTTLEPNLIDTVIDTEIRAMDIGVVYKKYIKTNTQSDGTTGFKLTWQLTDYGTE